jgi:hypothetical protein
MLPRMPIRHTRTGRHKRSVVRHSSHAALAHWTGSGPCPQGQARDELLGEGASNGNFWWDRHNEHMSTTTARPASRWATAVAGAKVIGGIYRDRP